MLNMDLNNGHKKRDLVLAISITIVIVIILCVNFNQIKKLFYNNQPQKTQVNNYKDNDMIENKGPEKTNNQNYSLKIDKLGIDTPIVLDVDGADEEEYNKSLENGVAHMKGTAKPGEDGNIVIFGHSSKNEKYHGDYGEIFAGLNNLETGDEIKIVDSEGNEINYKVESKDIVLPSDISVLDQNNRNRLTLLTCWPIGSNEKRLVIIAGK
jgi:sortase A